MLMEQARGKASFDPKELSYIIYGRYVTPLPSS
jgi:hypothetical protein